MKNKKRQASYVGKMGLVLCSFLLSLCLPLVGFADMRGGMSNKVFVFGPHLEPKDALIRSYFTYKASAGAKIDDFLDIENLSYDTIELNLFLADAQNPDQNKFVLKNPIEKQQYIAKWITLKKTSPITLKPHESVSVPFTIQVPEGTAVAEYWGGILAEETDQSQEKRTAAAKMLANDSQKSNSVVYKTRLGIRTLVQVVPEKNTQIERLLIGTQPNVPLSPLVTMPFGVKFYLAFILTYLLLVVGWFVYETLKRRRKLDVLINEARTVLIGLLILLMGLFLIFAKDSLQTLFTSVLGSGQGIVIRPAYTVDKDGAVTDRPSWFILKGAAGDTITGKAIVKNFFDEPMEARVNAVDASTSGGGFGLNSENNPQRDVGMWTSVEPANFHLDPHEEKEVNFTMKLPQVIEPGDHAGGLVVQEDVSGKKITNNEMKGNGVHLVTRVGARIYLTVAGETKFGSEASDFKITQGDDDLFVFSFTMKNTGNVHFNTKVAFDLHDSGDKSVKTYDAPDSSEFLPGSSAEVSITLPWKRLEDGKYKLFATVNDTKNTITQVLDMVVDASRPARVVKEVVVAQPHSAAVAAVPVPAPGPVQSPVLIYIIIGMAVVLLLVIGLMIVILLKKGKKSSIATPTQPPQNQNSGV